MDDRLKDAIDLLDLEGWLEEFVSIERTGGPEIRIETCPKCSGDNYKLYVNTDTKFWYCFKCTWGEHQHDITVFMAEISGRSLLDVRRELLQSVKPAPAGDLVDSLQAVFVMKSVKGQRSVQLINTPGSEDFSGLIGQEVENYLCSRGLSAEEIEQNRFRVVLTLRSFTGPFALVPVVYKDEPVGWQGRNVNEKVKSKYISSDKIANWLWPLDKERLATIRRVGLVCLVEGIYDALGLWRIGFPALCTFGKHITKSQIALLKEFGVQLVYLCWDADAGRTETPKLVNSKYRRGLRGEIEAAAIQLKEFFRVRIVDLSNPPVFPNLKKADPGEILRCKEVGDWVKSRWLDAIDCSSINFDKWRLS